MKPSLELENTNDNPSEKDKKQGLDITRKQEKLVPKITETNDFIDGQVVRNEIQKVKEELN